jgi:MoaA/NifB/PqqE/SkfB family radical SAM enzyme
MCDIWKANHEKKEISVEVLQNHVAYFRKLGVREVVFSGGEALMHSNLWQLCSVLREQQIRVTLLSTGLLLEKHAGEIVRHINEVIVSMDGSQPVHDRIRNIPQAYDKLVGGISALKLAKSDFRVTARCVLQRHNFNDLFNIITEAQKIRLDQISFLAADVSTGAFNRVAGWTPERVGDVALNTEEALAFENLIERSFSEFAEAYRTGFIAERPKKMEAIAQYYKAINGLEEFPGTVCNAPWVSAVIESDGSVMPCFFHKPYGNIYETDFLEIINSEDAVSFRKNLNVQEDPVCKKCVCSLKLGITQMN